MSVIVPGRRHAGEYLPMAGDTAAAIGNTGVQAVSTPATIAFVEQTCHLNIKDTYAAGWGSVGTSVDIRHVAPAWQGTVMVCESAVEAVTERVIRFSVRVSQRDRLIMSGWHERTLVEVRRFSARTPAATAVDRTPVEFFFDFHSPWCYLALERLIEIAAKHGHPIVWRPMHLANLIDRIGGRRPLEASAAFVRWYKQDMQEWAERRNLEVRYHPDFPLRPSRALRCSVYAAEQGRAQDFVAATMRAYWSQSRDISDLSTLGEIGESVGLSGLEVAAAGISSKYKQVVEQNTNEAIERGVFGAPSFLVGDRLFWGNDRLEMLDQYLGAVAQQRHLPEN
jgi:2-hydroxychromene-2-carboxylate isomerase/predicted thioesterase